MTLAAAERKLGVAEKLAAVICDPRDPLRVVHLLPDILRARIFAIACGYEDADDLDWLRSDAAFSLPADDCPIADTICARSRPCRAGRMRRRCASPSVSWA